jgi:hypothetical protein
VVEGAALEKRCAGNGTEGSNPSLSAIRIQKYLATDRVFYAYTPDCGFVGCLVTSGFESTDV